MSNTQIEALDRSIKEAKSLVEFGNAIDRLRGNKDFKAVFSKGYFELESVRLVHLKADPAMQSAESQRSILSQMDAIGAVAQYLTIGMQMARQAGKQMVDDETTREELLAEEA